MSLVEPSLLVWFIPIQTWQILIRYRLGLNRGDLVLPCMGCKDATGRVIYQNRVGMVDLVVCLESRLSGEGGFNLDTLMSCCLTGISDPLCICVCDHSVSVLSRVLSLIYIKKIP